VDYSCAIKLATPLAITSAMQEAARNGMLIKGGKYLEALAEADVVVLDKTGTLTEARPTVVDIRTFNGFSREYVLRNAACLEEHFPHPVASAVIRKAEEEGLIHDERHTTVDYIAAHGIASTLKGKRVVLGSRHFVHEDEGIDLEEAEAVLADLHDGCSVLYMAAGGRLAGIIILEDPLTEEAPHVVRSLKAMGIRKVIMLTGDHERSARKAAELLDLDEYHSQVLPDDKTTVIRRLQDEGYKVIMVGDGMNDSAALARADVGVSMGHGADIAQEACDVLILENGLTSLVHAITLSRGLMARVRRNFFAIVGINTALIALNMTGRMPPALSALLHNAATVGVSVTSTRPLLGSEMVTQNHNPER
jgi:Cu2+-exporting ATPase